MREWLSRLGIPIGGKSVEAVREQAERISRCKLTLQVRSATTTGLVNQTIVDTAIFLDLDGSRAPFSRNAPASAKGSSSELTRHPVPLEEAAVKVVSNNSMALDIYAWLAYRLHSLPGPRPIPWRALKPQFGAGFGRIDESPHPFPR